MADNLFEKVYKQLQNSRVILGSQIDTEEKKLSNLNTQKEELHNRMAELKIASSFLQSLVDSVAAESILKIEALVNTALKTIFYDMTLQFKIEQGVKRGNNVYF